MIINNIPLKGQELVMLTDVFEMFGASFLSVFVLMIVLWIMSCAKKNAGIVDIGWALGFILTALCCLARGDGVILKKIIMTTMVLCWAGRLAYHLISRFSWEAEDPRYHKIRESFKGGNADLNFLMIFLFQGILIVILSIPFVVVGADRVGAWHWYTLLGILLWGGGVSGEAMADYQLETFKKNPNNKGKVCSEGLWNYSRHPNYFFELVVWIGFFLFAYSSPLGSVSIIAPALMYFLLYYVSGVPMAEEQSLKSKGDAYREYQKTTNKFIPWFKNSS